MPVNGRLPNSDLAPIAEGRLRKDAARAWNAMNAEAQRRFRVTLLPTGSKSSYRTFAQQVELWNLWRSGRGNLAARPGTSNHGWGVAVDLRTPRMRQIVDLIGAKYGWAKKWSDAPGEWWHIKYRTGVFVVPTRLQRARAALSRLLKRRAKLRREHHDKGPVYAKTTRQMNGLKRWIARLKR